MDQFISLRLIYNSISDKESLDKKDTFWDNLYWRIRGWYLAFPLGPWEGPRANQMDQFISLRLIYNSISDKESLDKKDTFWDNLYWRIHGWYLALPLGPWEGPRANQVDQFISLRSIYSSISDKESLDKKDTFWD